MNYRKMGRTGLMVSELGIGCMYFGTNIPEKEATEIVNKAYEAGINYFDTANSYPPEVPERGASEEILGKAIKPFRDKVVISTKVRLPTSTSAGPNDQGLSRKHILDQADKSLKRLQTDYIDLYMAHSPDNKTPFDETLRAFNDLVRAGKVRYIGCSNYPVWQIGKALWISEKHNLARFDFVQTRYNLITREIEREMLPLCANEGLGVMIYNPLAGGLLAGGLYQKGEKLVSSYSKGATIPDGSRFTVPRYRERYWNDRNLEAVEKLQNIANRLGYTSPQVALAWLLTNKTVTSLLTAPDFVDQFDQNIAVTDITLSDEVITELDAIYDAMLPENWATQMGADTRGYSKNLLEFAY
ncbi:aldo/keto reductase [Thermodesulfobacteriota bacterium]